jgi:integrase
MATVRKRTWGAGTETKTAWIADYLDQDGKRRLKTFRTKKAADAWLVQARSQVAAGTHTPDSTSITVAEAAALWIKRGELERLERSTLDKYRNHVTLHINPAIGTTKLARLSAPGVESFRDDLLAWLSRPMAQKVLGSLKSILKEAQRRGLVAVNAAQNVKIKTKAREEAKLSVGLDIPTKAEATAIIAAATGRWRPVIICAVFTGMRSSELRGLRWDDVDLDRKLIHIRQRADQWGVIGPPKSSAGRRQMPMAPMVVNALKEWRLICPKLPDEGAASGRLWLVFPNGDGRVESHSNIINRGLNPILITAGCADPDPTVKDKDGKPTMRPRYGLHAFRHFFASWAIEQGFSAKKLQALMGHSSIQMTFDTYGHLCPSVEDDHAKFAAAELLISDPRKATCDKAAT